MKRTISFVLVLILCLVLVACGDETVTGGTTTAAGTTKQDNTTTTTTTKAEQTTTTTSPTTTDGSEQPTTVTTDKADTTTTTDKADNTTTTTKVEQTSTEEENSGVRGVSNKQRTEKVCVYEIDDVTYEVGVKKERTITYKGTIKVGNVMAISGSKYASYDMPFTLGMEAYINTINFDGGIGGDYENGVQGYYIEVLSYHNGGDYASSIYAYTRKLVEEDEVFAIINRGEAAVNDSVINYIKQTGVIACYCSSNSDLFETDAASVSEGSTIFPISPISVSEGRIIAGRLMKEHPEVRTIGIVYTNDDMGTGIRDSAKAQVECMGEGYSTVLCEVESANNLDFAMNRLKNCDAVIIAADQNITIKTLEGMIANGIYTPVFLPHNMASSYILISIQYKYKALAAENQFPIYSNFWLSPTDVDNYLKFAKDVMSYEGTNESIANTNAMYGWMGAKIFCEGLERIVEYGKEITPETYVLAMESVPVEVPMCSSVEGASLLDYEDGLRIGITRMGVLKSNETCNAFEEMAGLQNYIKFLQTGKISDIE